MNILHKEKERMRHHRQVKLLNKVMEHIPVSPNQSKTKVKKLRHLVLYTHYLKMVHAQVTKSFSITVEDNKKIIKDKISKPVKTPLRKIYICKQKQKRQKAHIVFLHADKSVNQTENSFENSLLSDDVETSYADEESMIVEKCDYRTPDVVVFKEKSNNANPNQEIAFSPEKFSNIQMNSCIPVSFDKYEIPHHSIFKNHCDKIYESNIFIENPLSNEKENFSSVATSNLLLNYNEKIIEDIPAQNVERFSQNVIVDDRNIRENYYDNNNYNIYKKYSDNYILKDLTFANTANKSCDNSSSVQNREYLLNSCKDYPLQNVSDMYEYSLQSSAENFICESPSLLSNNFYLTDYYLNSASLNAQSYNWSVSMEEDMYNNNYFTISNDRMDVDVENQSDSNPSYTNLSDGSNPVNANYYYDSPVEFYCENVKLPVEQVIPVQDYKTIRQSISNMQRNSHFENHSLENEILFTPLSSSYSCNIYPTNFSFNRSSRVILPSESLHSLSNGNTQCSFISDPESLYSPSFENFQSDIPQLHSKSELTNFGGFQESSQNSAKPSFFEEETSYSLAQYFKNC